MSRNYDVDEIADPALIISIISELSVNREEGIIRPVQERKLGVRFAFGETFFNSRPHCFLLGSISDHGLARLQPHAELVVEVYDAEYRITFTCSVLQRSAAGIYVALPLTLSKSERRLSQRFKTSEERLPFFDPKTWAVDGNEITAPPVFGLYQPLAAWAPIVDISFGGICIETRFPSLLSWLEENTCCTHAELIFPLLKPLAIGMELRWTKRIRERSPIVEGGNSIHKYRIGLTYLDPSREFKLELGRFIKELHMESAI